MPSSSLPDSRSTEPASAEEAVILTMISLGRRLRQRLPGDEVDIAAFHVLKTLCHHGPMRLSSLASALELDASTVSRHARHLEDRGLVERTDDPDDGRASRVAISEQGVSCLDKCTEARRVIVADILSGWSDQDREQLRVLLNRFQHDLTEHTHPHPTSSHHTKENA
jgi:DNA-binding MarR family transcriptional regulator